MKIRSIMYKVQLFLKEKMDNQLVLKFIKNLKVNFHIIQLMKLQMKNVQFAMINYNQKITKNILN